MVPQLLGIQDPRLLLYLLESIAYSMYVGYGDIANKLIGYFMAMASTILGLQHPITIFSAGLHQPDSPALRAFIEIGLQTVVDQFSTQLGAGHLETMRILLTSSTILKHLKSFTAASRNLDTLLPLYENAYGTESYQVVHCLVDKAYVEFAQLDLPQAESFIIMAMKRATLIGDLNERVESEVRCLVCLEQLRKLQHDLAQASYSLSSALELGSTALSHDHWMMRDARAQLEEVIEQGL